MADNKRKRRGHSRYIVFFVLIIIALAGISWGSYAGLRQAAWLNIREVRIVGNKYLSAQILQSLVHKYYGNNLVDLSSATVAADLKKLKRIERVQITRLFPSTLKIKITEREGFLYIKSQDGELFPIDKNKMIIEHASYPILEDLPIVHTTFRSNQLLVGRRIGDPFVLKVVALHQKIATQRPEFVKNVSEYYQADGLVYLLEAEHGARIILGHENINDQLRRFEFVLENGDIAKSSVLDLRFNNQVVVKNVQQD